MWSGRSRAVWWSGRTSKAAAGAELSDRCRTIDAELFDRCGAAVGPER